MNATRGAPKAFTSWRTGARRLVSAIGTWVKGLSYLPKWLVLGAAVGVIAGFGAVAFYEALTFGTHIFLGLLAGYQVPTPAGEGNASGSVGYVRPWVVPLVVVLGGLLSGWLVFTFAPEAEGHGTDAGIEAVHHNPRGIRLIAVIVKIVASALTIGSGGSGGREGPTAQISAGFGSLLARILDLSPEDGRIAVSIGIGSGIGAIFSAPLGGAVLAADIVYRDDFDFSALLPGFFASIIAYAIFGAFLGYRPLFAAPGYHFDHPIQLLWFAIIGIIAGFLGLLYSKTFYGVVDLSHRLPNWLPRHVRPAIGAVGVGLIALALPQVLGTGYGWVQKDLSTGLLHTPLIVILALPLARILATALSIGSGGSGGVFGPGMVIGAFTGLAVWRILEPIAPGVGHDPAVYIVVAMMAVFGGISRAPLAVMVMVGEMTGNISVLAPAMVAVAISTFIVHRFDDSIYRAQLHSRADSTASRMHFGLPLLGSIEVAAVAEPPRLVLHDTERPAEALAALTAAEVPGAPVVDARGTYLGRITGERLVDAGRVDAVLPSRRPPDSAVRSTTARPARADAGTDARTDGGDAEAAAGRGAGTTESGRATLRALIDETVPTVASDATLDVALEALVHAGGRWVTVTDNRRRVVAILSVGALVRGYLGALDSTTGEISRVTFDVSMLEERVAAGAPVAGMSVRDAGLPGGTVIVTIQRDTTLLPPTGSTVLRPGDMVSALVEPEAADALRRRLRGKWEAGGVREPDGDGGGAGGGPPSEIAAPRSEEPG